MPTVRVLNIGAKACLAALLAHAALFPDLPRYVDKGMGYRFVFYPLAAVIVPLVWWALIARRRPGLPYPAHIDLCVTLPFLADMAGNTANLFDTITWWDDVMHVVNWVPWVVAFGFAIRYTSGSSRGLPRWAAALVVIGFGAVTHILWEVGEYLTFVADSPSEALSAYRDTIGDLVLSLAGSIVGGVLVASVLWDVGRPRQPTNR